MKSRKKFQTHFEKASKRTTEEIKAACDKMKSARSDFDIRSNGNHIWIEMGEKKQQYWSPMLHLSIENEENKTTIKGKFAENPMLWIAFLVTKGISIAVFTVALIVAYFKYISGWNFNPELFIMFAMVSTWFAMFLISENYKRKGARQIEELHLFVDYISEDSAA